MVALQGRRGVSGRPHQGIVMPDSRECDASPPYLRVQEAARRLAVAWFNPWQSKRLMALE
jgi:hypothetical protein